MCFVQMSVAKSSKLIIIFSVFLVVPAIIMSSVVNAVELLKSPAASVNLSHWREHRRRKRFILFENAGISKLVTGISFPIDLGDKKAWRQLVVTYNFHYQFPVPPKPIYWWNNWNVRSLTGGSLDDYKDETQEMIYEFVENMMERRGMNGRACLQRMICENAQVHRNQGLYAQILHRVLQPHRNLHPDYTDAWHAGRSLMNCRAIYLPAKKCLWDDYMHVWRDVMPQHFVEYLET